MEPAFPVALLFVLFAATHIGLASRPIRGPLVARLGEWGFVLMFSLVAALSFALFVNFYATHRQAGLAGLALGDVPALGLVLQAAIVTGVALIAAGLVAYSDSPMTLYWEQAHGPKGIERITRHSFFAGVFLLSVAHALLATRLVGTVLFAGLALFSAVGAWHQDRKLLRLRGQPYAEYLAATSALPFVAVLAGRQRIVWSELPLLALASGVALAFGLRAIHSEIFAAGGAWVIGVVVGGAGLALAQDWYRSRRRRARGAGRPGFGAAAGR